MACKKILEHRCSDTHFFPDECLPNYSASMGSYRSETTRRVLKPISGTLCWFRNYCEDLEGDNYTHLVYSAIHNFSAPRSRIPTMLV
jgi:hypothetical protein